MRPLATRRFVVAAFSAWLCVVPFPAQADPGVDSSRGALLYETHCLACHSAQVHWRDHSLVRDWESLTRQVARWQASANLQWGADDIDAVSRYLDDAYYRLPAPVAPPLPNRG